MITKIEDIKPGDLSGLKVSGKEIKAIVSEWYRQSNIISDLYKRRADRGIDDELIRDCRQAASDFFALGKRALDAGFISAKEYERTAEFLLAVLPASQ